MTLEPARIAAGVGALASLLIVAYGAHMAWISGASISGPMPSSPSLRMEAPHAGAAPDAAPARPAGVWAPNRPISRGQRIAAGDLVLVPLHENLPPGAILRAEDAVGRIALADLPAYTLLQSDRLTNDPARAGLALTIPPGYRAVALRTNDEIAVGNFIRPGDHVDVLLLMRESVLPKPGEIAQRSDGNPSEVRLLIEDAAVLTVGDSLGAEEPRSGEPRSGAPPAAPARKPEPPHGVTLALTPDQASQLVLGRALGTLTLALRNPSDLGAVGSATARLSGLRGVAAPAGPVEQGRRPVEVITGPRGQAGNSAEPAGRR